MSEVVSPPNRLMTVVSNGDGPDLQTILSRAAAALASIKDDYVEELRCDIAAIEQLLPQLTTNAGQDSAAARAHIYRTSHEVRGLAGTFDYPLLSAIGSSLCLFLEQAGDRADLHINVIEAHVGAMKAVLAENVTGDGGTRGRVLRQSLSRLNAKALAPSRP